MIELGLPARLDINLWFDCPHCECALDLLNENDCWETGSHNDTILAWEMIKTWLSNKDFEQVQGTCSYCKMFFTIRSIEY